jgi:hypothetical protein
MPAALAAALALVFSAPATAALPLGAPETVRLARPGDERQHPRALAEWWQVAAINPRSGAAVRIRIARDSRIGGVDVNIDTRSLQVNERLGQQPVPHRRRGLTATGVEGTTTLRRVRGGWRLRMKGPLVSGRLRLHRARPGPTALRWRLGDVLRWPQRRWEPSSMNWSALAATSRVTGRLTYEGRRLRLDGWRAALEHVWGQFRVDDDVWEGLNSFTTHRRGGGAALVFGLNRIDTMGGAGARDAQWLGVLALVGKRRQLICRPMVHRRRWDSPEFGWVAYALTLRARCGRARVTFRATGDRPSPLWGGVEIAHYELAWRARASGGGRGLAIAFGHHSYL